MNRSIYFDEWQACLRAHYIHVIRTHDTVTEPTLRHVLLRTGLTEADLAALANEARARGTLHPDAEFDPVAGSDEIVMADAAPDQAPPSDELVEDTGEIEAMTDEAYPDTPYTDQGYLEDPYAEAGIEGGYDEHEIDGQDLDASDTDADEPPPDEPPVQQLSLF